MARYNTAQEREVIAKLKPKIEKAQAAQRKREKNKKWIKVEDAPGNLLKLEK